MRIPRDRRIPCFNARLLADCKNDKTSNVKIDLIDESPFHLKGSFPGPEGTPYEGGHFEVVRASTPVCSCRALTDACYGHRISGYRKPTPSNPSR